ncbi:hypothetical protein MHY1_00820 [Methylovirgula sp. HY1]|nr:hypothetical protein MHY1_00820 [Methylovirgula sp. HY1]
MTQTREHVASCSNSLNMLSNEHVEAIGLRL